MRAEELLTPKGELSEMLNSVRSGAAVSAFGIRGYGRIIAAAQLKRMVYVCEDISSARAAQEEFSALNMRTAYMPQRSDVISCTYSRSLENDFSRLSALTAFLAGDADVLITTSASLVELYPPKARLLGGIIEIIKGNEYDIPALTHTLSTCGYERSEQVTAPGFYSVRGDILDVWSIGSDSCVRIEFFGDEADAIHSFDAADQTTKEAHDSVKIYPATDLYGVGVEVGAAVKAMRAKSVSPRLESAAAFTSEQIENGARSMRYSFLLPVFPHESFSEVFSDETVVIEDAKSVADNALVLIREHEARFSSLRKEKDTFEFSSGAIYNSPQLSICRAGRLAYHRVDGQNRIYNPNKLYNFRSADLPDYTRDLTALADDIEMWQRRGYSVTVACGNETTRERLHDLFIDCRRGGGANLVTDFLPHGAIFFESETVVIGSLDIGKRAVKKALGRKGRDAFVLPEVGDYVVHRVHGIGICESISRLDLGGTERDYVVVLYAGGDKLYLPIENIDSLSKFVASEHPKLSKIGGVEFSRLKDKVRRSVKEMAFSLIELYAARANAKGHAYSPDDSLLDAFINEFPYAETEDQLTATDEGLSDLKKGRIMDRLLCGDVGFGKTEVAMRLAFKVICEGKQVAFISPTTILAHQHYETVKARMEGFGVSVGELTRFNSRDDITRTISGLKSGKVDIVCGTHRVLSNDVGFADLGLLILDEEQRFGVADKEKIKSLKVNVNVLSLSATPIPRTLHMSMTGIRDISVLDTPPADRLPVQTFVTEYSEALVRDAIMREVGRGGQVFVVYNRVADIDSFASSVSALVPELKVSVAHGQLPENSLNRIIGEFSEGKTDVLVASTIIENGIDIPRANTMIVVDSDRLGLSQMYQLRGRVGRSNRLAYVYFTYEPTKVIGETAYKRLDAITEYTELSSGFSIAMRDLEIRGAGNILGREQHGHIEKVGYDTYCRILKSAVEELRGGVVEEEKNDVAVSCDFSAFVPERYVPDREWRVRLYARIAKLKSRRECDELITDLKDIYGEPPATVLNLVRVGYVKNLAFTAGASSVSLKSSASRVTFPSVKDVPDYAATYIAVGKGVSFTDKEVRITFTGDNSYEDVCKFLEECHKK